MASFGHRMFDTAAKAVPTAASAPTITPAFTLGLPTARILTVPLLL